MAYTKDPSMLLQDMSWRLCVYLGRGKTNAGLPQWFESVVYARLNVGQRENAIRK